MHTDNSNQLCNSCPRQCNVNRGEKVVGFCNADDQPLIASVFLHKGEEPVISGKSGICNVFFAHCNLQCVYCQNYQISQNDCSDPSWLTTVDDAVNRIIDILDKDINILGFVSPSHQITQMIEIIEVLRSKSYKPIIVYNSNGYDSVETLRKLEGLVDVYLPDFKYYSSELSLKYSSASDYFDVASNALREMHRQKGSAILLDDNEMISSGIIVRHLVLPGLADDSIKILEHIAYEISPFLNISLMSQYFPTQQVFKESSLNRKVRIDEYSSVIDKLYELGFKGWIQDFESSDFYRPDFYRDTPFL